MPMNVILLERVPKLGQMGDVVKVKPGYARNFLLPQKKALRATKDNIAYFESQRKVLEAQNLERRSEAEAAGAKVKDLKVTLIRKASEALQLYGSRTPRSRGRRGRQSRREKRRERGKPGLSGLPNDKRLPATAGVFFWPSPKFCSATGLNTRGVNIYGQIVELSAKVGVSHRTGGRRCV